MNQLNPSLPPNLEKPFSYRPQRDEFVDHGITRLSRDELRMRSITDSAANLVETAFNAIDGTWNQEDIPAHVGVTNLEHVEEVAKDIGRAVVPYGCPIYLVDPTRSTASNRSTEKAVRAVRKKAQDADSVFMFFVSNPDLSEVQKVRASRVHAAIKGLGIPILYLGLPPKDRSQVPPVVYPQPTPKTTVEKPLNYEQLP